jgi:hypothetical protein
MRRSVTADQPAMNNCGAFVPLDALFDVEVEKIPPPRVGGIARHR